MNLIKLVFAWTVLSTAAPSILSVDASAADAILIEFRSESCQHSRTMSPIVARLEQRGTAVRRVDVAAEPGLTDRYRITETPTYLIVGDGQEITRLVGTHTESELIAALAIDPQGPLTTTASQRDAASTGGELSQTPQTLVQDIAPTRLMPLSSASPETAGEAMPSATAAAAVERARAATVRLRVYDGRGFGVGTGTVIDTHGEEALVMTCGHLFRDTQGKGRIEVDLFVGGEVKTVAGQVVDYDADERDIALVAIRPGVAMTPIDVISTSTQPVAGQSVFSFGCDRGDDPSRRDTRITGINKYNQHLQMSNIEIDGAPIDGRSGGGLFDQQGRLIGVCNAADYKGDVGIYTGPGSIHWQLDRVNLGHLAHRDGGGPDRLANAAGQIQDHPRGDSVTSPGRLPEIEMPLGDGPAAADIALADVAPGDVALADVAAGDQEVIVIIRNRSDPAATARVMTIPRPSDQWMRSLMQQASAQ